MKPDNAHELTRTTVVVHWVVGIAIILQAAIGLYMTETETFPLYPWHKSFGVIIFFLAAVWVVRRIMIGWPERIREYQPFERVLSTIVHHVLLIAIILMPLSGFLMSSFGGTGVALFGLDIVPRNPDPANPQRVIAHNEAAATFFRGVHGWVAYILVIALLLHIAGALKHHFMDKDGTLRRMLGARV